MSSAKKSSKSSSPETASINSIKDLWLRGGLLALILVVFAAGLVMLAFRIWEPPELAKLLPAAETLHYEEGNLPTETLPPGTTSLHGQVELLAGRDLSTQALLTSRLEFYTIGQRNRLLLDETHRLFKRYYVVALEPHSTVGFSLLEHVRLGEIPSLEQDSLFRAMRPALPYRAPRFELDQTWYWWAEKSEAFFSAFPLFEPLKIDFGSLTYGAFPLFGSVKEKTDMGTLTQTYVAGLKDFKITETEYPFLFHLDKKYKGKLLSYLPENLTTLYAGEQLATTLEQLIDLLNYASETPPETPLLTEKIDRLFTTYFGPALDRRQILNPLLDNEYALGFFESANAQSTESPVPLSPLKTINYQLPTAPSLLALELTPDTTPLLDQLVQAFLAQGLVQIDRENSSIKAEKLTPQRTEYRGTLYDLYILPGGQPFLAALIKDDVAILTTGKSEMEQVIEAMGGAGRYTDSEKYRMIEPLIDKVDHLRAQAATPIGLPAAVGANLFDDGMMIFTHEQP